MLGTTTEKAAPVQTLTASTEPRDVFNCKGHQDVYTDGRYKRTHSARSHEDASDSDPALNERLIGTTQAGTVTLHRWRVAKLRFTLSATPFYSIRVQRINLGPLEITCWRSSRQPVLA